MTKVEKELIKKLDKLKFFLNKNDEKIVKNIGSKKQKIWL